MGARWGTVQRRDPNEPEIVDALEEFGVEVHRLHQPADLLVRFRRAWYVLEVTHPERATRDKDQLEFLRRCEVPLVETVDQALRAIGAVVVNF